MAAACLRWCEARIYSGHAHKQDRQAQCSRRSWQLFQNVLSVHLGWLDLAKKDKQNAISAASPEPFPPSPPIIRPCTLSPLWQRRTSSERPEKTFFRFTRHFTCLHFLTQRDHERCGSAVTHRPSCQTNGRHVNPTFLEIHLTLTITCF